MHVKLPTWIILAAALASTSVHAQDLSQIPPPTHPFVAPVPENADWVVTADNPVEKPAAPPPPGAMPRVDRRVSELHDTKTGKLKRELINYVNGTTEEHWFVDNYYFWTPPHQDVSVYNLNNVAPSPDNPGPPGAASGYAGVGWVSLKTYEKVVVYEGAPCYHYLDSTQNTEAWINAQTRLPVAYKAFDILYKYKFNAPPAAPLTMPPAYQKAWDRLKVMTGIQ